ncbi:hypothetical protein [Streptomyces asiaticus]|uniref:hypothetical protein n=1 Tax=Streptomyces asiaticus TaxID=114695 RepID=UPI003F679ED7
MEHLAATGANKWPLTFGAWLCQEIASDNAGAGQYCGGGGVEEEHERPGCVCRVDAPDAERLFCCLEEEVDGGGEGQRRLTALPSDAEPRPVGVCEAVGRNHTFPDDEGSAGDQRVACRPACRGLHAEHPGEPFARHPLTW